MTGIGRNGMVPIMVMLSLDKKQGLRTLLEFYLRAHALVSISQQGSAQDIHRPTSGEVLLGVCAALTRKWQTLALLRMPA